ncbi:Undecaprenyl-diphosphatase [uncultured archaeon]|nr:Undecaprenyl-diphosphatase [uncultured archaeon]
MDTVSVFLLGALQGVLEWLPVSSSGQSVLILTRLLHVDPQAALEWAFYLHAGTLLAVLIKFKDDIRMMLLAPGEARSGSTLRFVVVGTLTTAVVGTPVFLLLHESFGSFNGEVVTGLVGLFLVVTGLVIYRGRRLPQGLRDVQSARLSDMVFLGVIQGIAVVPGISRSGTTVAAFLSRGFRQDEALRMSFIMSAPAVFGLLGLEFIKSGFSVVSFQVAATGVLAAFVFGYLTLDVLLGLAHKIRFDVFCIVFGSFAVLLSVLPYF